jgi:hypothetical protein
MDRADLWRRVLAEWLGSALLAAAVIGSGIAAQRLSPGQTSLELFENAAATVTMARVRFWSYHQRAECEGGGDA